MNKQDKRIRDYYSKLNLSQDKLDLLMQAQQTAVKPSLFSKFITALKPLSPKLTAVAACVCLLVVTMWVHDSASDSERMQRMVQEVAMNHTTRLEPEYRGENLTMLDNSMQQLPFALVLPKAIDETYTLVGSRYCSLAGELAAHVRLTSRESGKPMSLFVTSNSAALKSIEDQQTKLNGVDVEFWREGGLFFARAQRS